MRHASVRLVSFVLVIVLFTAGPAGLSAKEKRGAMLFVTKLDGRLVQGELIAVKPDALLLLVPGGADLSVPISEINVVRIVRRSKAGTFSLIGGAAGFVGMGGVVLAVADSDVVDSKVAAAFIYGLLTGAAGAALGAILGSAAGADSVFVVAGQPAEAVADYWARLSAYARMGRMPRPGPGPAGRFRGPRFRLSAAAHFPGRQGSSFGGASAFRFPEETAPETGPYPMDLHGFTGGASGGLRLGPVAIAYDWRKDWAAEIELMPVGLGYNYIGGEMSFTSSLDGLPYWSGYNSSYSMDCLAVLAGLSYRPIAPSALQRHAIEVGLAAGPAFIGLKNEGEGIFLLPPAHKVAVCARAKVGYDFEIGPALSLGAFAGYRYLETSFGGLEGSMTAIFMSSAEPYPELHRQTTAALPALPVKASGFYWGLRAGLRI